MARESKERKDRKTLRQFDLQDFNRRFLDLEQLFEKHSHDNTGNQKISANALTDGTVIGFLQSRNFVTGSSGSGWKLSPDGTFEASDGNFRGDITGATGTFSGSITIGTGNNVVKADSTDGFWVGHADFASAPAKISLAGVLTATGVNISGTITATGGAIGGFIIGADFIRDVANSMGMASTVTGSDDVRFWAGDSFANRATADFHVTESGALVASNATITGAINATSGDFSGSITVSGSLTGGIIQTSSSGSRVVMNGSDNALYLYDSGGTKRVQVRVDGLTLFDSSGNESGSFKGRGTGEIDIIPSGSGTLFITGQITASALIFSETDIIADVAFIPGVNNVTILGETSPSIAAFREGYINKILGNSGANVIDLGISGEIAMNQPLNLVAAYKIERAGTTRIFMDAANTEHFAHFVPNTTAANHNLGSDGQRWGTVFSQNADDITSDIRFKDNIKPLNYGLDEIMKMNPISYDKSGRHLGFSAQEIREIIPEIISGKEDEKGLGLKYTEIIPILVNAIKEQQKQIDKLTLASTSAL